MTAFATVARLFVFSAAIAAVCLCRADEAYTTATQVRPILKTTADAAAQPIEYPRSGTPEITGVLVELPVGAQTGWHTHQSTCIAYIMQGNITVELEDGTKNAFKTGDSFVEVRNLRHCGTNTGTEPVKILFYAIGTQGTPISIASPKK